MIEHCCEYLPLRCISMYVIIMSFYKLSLYSFTLKRVCDMIITYSHFYPSVQLLPAQRHRKVGLISACSLWWNSDQKAEALNPVPEPFSDSPSFSTAFFLIVNTLLKFNYNSYLERQFIIKGYLSYKTIFFQSVLCEVLIKIFFVLQKSHAPRGNCRPKLHPAFRCCPQ